MAKRLKVAICGASKGDLREDVLMRVERLGELIAANGHVLLTGACTGYPEAACVGYKALGGDMSVGFSVGNNWEENLKLYPGMDEGIFDLVVYTGLGEGRNFVLVKSADVCIFMGKGSGTLMELTIALKYGKRIAVLDNSGGIDEILDQVLDLSWDHYPEIVRSADPEELVRAVFH
ncbi:hypothetical protein CVV38_04085 [Candidatus Peregrinibacteria bacterium HGW-Peregrinibacteria-1]|jgi:hypothetical protein|nr:MAG: hypothetical protein CVV38_04085 [Candidatus Peregrinibacteria bacterium HGW-Peregrinibacteria-1]